MTGKHRLQDPLRNYSVPPVSIIVLNYNGYKWLRLFLSNLISTRYPCYEIIVVDNASTDESVQYLSSRKLDLVKLIELPENKGFAEGINIAAKEATGEILVLLNNDVEVSTEWLTEAVLKLVSNPVAGAVQSKIMQYKERNKIDYIGISVDKYCISRAIGKDEVDNGQYDHLDEIGVACGAAMAVWKHIFYEVGGFDPSFFMYYEDADLSLRIRRAGYKIMPASSSVVYHVGSGTSAATPSSFVPYHYGKNYTICWLKNSPRQTIILSWPIILFVVLLWVAFSISEGHPFAAFGYLKGASWTLVHLPYVLRERRRSENLIKRSPLFRGKLFLNVMNSNSSHLPYLLKRARSRIFEKLKISTFYSRS